MTHIYTTIDIQAPPDRVWAAVRDTERWSEWTPTIISIQRLDPGPLAVRTRATVRQPKLLPARWRITAIEEGRSCIWTTRAPGILVTACHSIHNASNGSRATLSHDFSGPFGAFCAGLTRGINAGYLAIEARGLKKRAKADGESR